MADSSDDRRPFRVLFVCLGNICRSPLAEGVFLHLVEENGLQGTYEADSAGTGAWHVGEPPDERAAAVARRHGIRLVGPARQIRPTDGSEFDLILAMDESNLGNVRGAIPKGGAEIRLLRDFDPQAAEDRDVPDPYYGGDDGFDIVFQMVRRSCARLLETLEEDGER